MRSVLERKKKELGGWESATSVCGKIDSLEKKKTRFRDPRVRKNISIALPSARSVILLRNIFAVNIKFYTSPFRREKGENFLKPSFSRYKQNAKKKNLAEKEVKKEFFFFNADDAFSSLCAHVLLRWLVAMCYMMKPVLFCVRKRL